MKERYKLSSENVNWCPEKPQNPIDYDVYFSKEDGVYKMYKDGRWFPWSPLEDRILPFTSENFEKFPDVEFNVVELPKEIVRWKDLEEKNKDFEKHMLSIQKEMEDSYACSIPPEVIQILCHCPDVGQNGTLAREVIVNICDRVYHLRFTEYKDPQTNEMVSKFIFSRIK